MEYPLSRCLRYGEQIIVYFQQLFHFFSEIGTSGRKCLFFLFILTVVNLILHQCSFNRNYGFVFLMFGLSCTFIIDFAGATGLTFATLNWVFVIIGFVGAALCSQIRYLTSKVSDEKALKHHRATSSIGSMI